MLGLFAIVLLYFMFCEASYDASPIQTCISTFSIQKITGLVYEIRMLSSCITGLVYEISYALFAYLHSGEVYKRDTIS